MSAKDGKILTTLPLPAAPTARSSIPATMEAFATLGNGRLAVVKETSPTSFEMEQDLETMNGARTIALDTKTGHVFTMAQEYGPPPRASPPAAGTPPPSSPRRPRRRSAGVVHDSDGRQVAQAQREPGSVRNPVSLVVLAADRLQGPQPLGVHASLVALKPGSVRNPVSSSSRSASRHPIRTRSSCMLGANARAQFNEAEAGRSIIYVPAAVVWEVALLARAVRINLHRPVRAFFADLFSNPAYQPHDLTPSQIFDAEDLRFTHDPFDALIVAAARDLDLPLVTRDGAIRESGAVQAVW